MMILVYFYDDNMAFLAVFMMTIWHFVFDKWQCIFAIPN